MLILLVVTINCIIRSIAIMYFYPNNRNSFLVSWAIFWTGCSLSINFTMHQRHLRIHIPKRILHASIELVAISAGLIFVSLVLHVVQTSPSEGGSISLTAFTERNSLIMRHFSGIHLSSSARLFPVFDARKRHAWYVSKYKAQASGRTEISLDCHRVYVYTRMSVFVHL